MWRRLSERLLNTVGIALGIAWLVASFGIAMGPLDLEGQRSNLKVVALIFLSPFAVMMVVEEVVHRIKHGPAKPGRHSRDAPLTPEDLFKLDRNLRRRKSDTSGS